MLLQTIIERIFANEIDGLFSVLHETIYPRLSQWKPIYVYRDIKVVVNVAQTAEYPISLPASKNEKYNISKGVKSREDSATTAAGSTFTTTR